MKRILALSLTLIFAFCGVVYAAGVNGQYKDYDIVRVQFEGKELKPDDVPGILLDGRTMIPLGLLRKAGFTVEWDSKTLTANVTTKQDIPPGKVLTFDQIKKMSDRIALIYALDENGVRREQGSGFMLNSRGLLVTAFHVIEEQGQYQSLEIIVRGKTYKVPAGAVVFEDAKRDIAGVYLYDKEPFPYFKVGELPKVNDKVYNLAYPMGELQVNESKIFYVPEHLMFDTAESFGGSSGGALLNIYGQVVGVHLGGNGELGGASISIKHVLDNIEKSLNN